MSGNWSIAPLERLVGVEVDGMPVGGGQLEGVLDGRHRLRLEVGTAADDVGAHLHRLIEGGPVAHAELAGGRHAVEGDDLEVDHVLDGAPGADQCLDAPRADVDADVDMRANGRDAVGGQHPHCPLGPLGDVIHGERGPVGEPRLDGAEEIARGIRHAIGRQRLVEVGVGLGRRRQQEVAVEIDDGLAVDRPEVLGDSGDAIAGEAHVDPAPVGQRGSREEHQEEGRGRRSMASPRRGMTSSATRWSCSSICSRVRPGRSKKMHRCSRPTRSR
jgi:hypothetical protein